MIDSAPILRLAEDGTLRLRTVPGRTFPEVKEATGATWVPDLAEWKFPAIRANVIQVQEIVRDVAMTDSARVLLEPVQVRFPVAPPSGGQAGNGQPDLRRDLYGFQQHAVDVLVAAPRGHLVVMSPGLGKTATTLVAARETGAKTVLVVAPLSLVYTWQREASRWAHADMFVAHGRPPEGDWVVTNYETVTRHPEWFKGPWDVLVVDESVLVKNKDAKRTKALDKIRPRAGRAWLLSGSPTTRYADDLYAQMRLIYPAAFKSYWRFAARYCVLEESIWSKSGKEVIGTRDGRDLAHELGDLMLVMHQEDVLPELPEYLYETIDVELTNPQRKAYQSMLSDFLIELESGGEMTADTILAQLIRLQQVTSGMANIPGTSTSSAKNDAVVELLETGAYEDPTIIWTHWKQNASLLATLVGGVHVSGDLPNAKRDEVFEAFKAGGIKRLVLSLEVGKFGHTFTNAKTVIYLDKTWSADAYFQSLRRVRRIGLTHRPVVVTVRAPRTVDELVEMNLAGKMPSIAKVTNSQLKELLKGLGL